MGVDVASNNVEIETTPPIPFSILASNGIKTSKGPPL